MRRQFFPRREGDTPFKGPVWKLAKEEMYSEIYLPSEAELEEMKGKLNKELETLMKNA